MNINKKFVVLRNFNQLLPKLSNSLKVLILLLSLYTVLLTCWIGDDALITLKQVWNFINGEGITFNFDQRVQAFSHPLWFLLLSVVIKLTNEVFLTTSFLMVILSTSAITILLLLELKLNKKEQLIISPTIILLFSWAFVDYMTSGLENNLSYLLTSLILFVLTKENWKNKYKITFFLLSLLILNRIDYLVLFFPLFIYLLFQNKNLNYLVRSMFPGIIIIVSWFLFSTFYFGSPFSNTFYAKLSAGYPFSEYLTRGLDYYLELILDPITILVILCGIIVSILSRSGLLISLMIGQLAYMIYILFIGGDFMHGRFFAIITFISLGQIIIGFGIIRQISLKFKNLIIMLSLSVILIGRIFLDYPIFSNNEYTYRTTIFDSFVSHSPPHL